MTTNRCIKNLLKLICLLQDNSKDECFCDEGCTRPFLGPTINCICYNTRVATVYKGNIIKNLIMDCQSYTKYRPNETTGGIFVSWRRKEELPTGA